MKTVRKSKDLQEHIRKDLDTIQYLARVATKKVPSEDLIRKHVLLYHYVDGIYLEHGQ